MYRDIVTQNLVEAEQLTEKRKLGSITIPPGYWVVNDNGVMSYPSNYKFSLRYELVFNEPTELNVADQSDQTV